MELSDYVLELLRENEEFILYRGHAKHADAAPLLLLAPASTRPAPETLKKIEHEYSLRAELDATWTVRPLAPSHYNGQPVLVLANPGGDPLDRLFHGPIEIRRFLRIAMWSRHRAQPFTSARADPQRHQAVEYSGGSAAGQVWLTGFGIASRLPRERQSPEPPGVHRRDAPLHGA